MKKNILKKYAELIVRKGANVQKGQEVVISASLDQPEFVKFLVEFAYKAGAKRVTVDWSYQPLSKIHTKYRSVKSLGTLEDWEIEKLRHQVKVVPARIILLSEDPDGLKGINQAKIAKSSKMRYPIIKPFRDALDNIQQWTIAAVPGIAWAKKVFPTLSKSAAVNKLWEVILATSRATDDPIKAWEDHNRNLKQRCEYLDSLKLTSLTYKSKNGTDFTVGLLENARFIGGEELTADKKIPFNPNIPTEECFVTPKKGVIDGKVVSTKPLSYQGQLIEDFHFIFKDGKVVEAHAKTNEHVLKEMINMDEGASMLGEVALVPVDSPISQSNILFYETLFDENASCHLALGRGFTNSIINYEKYTEEDFIKMGVNESMIHVDFMIGNADLSIVGKTKDGKTIDIFKNGTWAF